MLIHRAGHRGTKRTADKDAGHVERVQAAAAFGVKGVDGPLAEDHVHLHAEVEHHAGDGEADDAVDRMDERGQEAQAGDSSASSEAMRV